MLSTTYGYAFALVTALIVILGDYILKLAADGGMPLTSRHVLAGCLIYALSGLMWYFAVLHISLAQAGVAFSMLSLLALCVIGAVAFDEPIETREAAGIGCALLSMVLMARFA